MVGNALSRGLVISTISTLAPPDPRSTIDTWYDNNNNKNLYFGNP
jgi:hypothetical protein